MASIKHDGLTSPNQSQNDRQINSVGHFVWNIVKLL